MFSINLFSSTTVNTIFATTVSTKPHSSHKIIDVHYAELIFILIRFILYWNFKIWWQIFIRELSKKKKSLSNKESWLGCWLEILHRKYRQMKIINIDGVFTLDQHQETRDWAILSKEYESNFIIPSIQTLLSMSSKEIRL